ncbi:hypothetical protein HPB50_019037 [Hyalomma asiaticum]|uniref:Uncharacterized protein n=1 Tax=Hyalomma asiaticum TaxID=266040 RepID=A0ACB7TMR4_HYAAI|nr:hypothetical protein HPB50_019037 [Hyalomma asiaticum]
MPPTSGPPVAVVTKMGPVMPGSAQASPATTTPTDFEPRSTAKDLFQRDKEVINSEVIWCLNAVMTHSSFRAAAALASLFPLMFPSSATANKMQLGRDKVAYTIVCGLAPFFKESLMSEVNEAPYLVIAFDELLNKVAQKEQMGMLVRYLMSCFLGRTRAEELVSAFKRATEGLSRSKILQISMDEPNVNMKFLREIKEELRESNDGHLILDNKQPISASYAVVETAIRDPLLCAKLTFMLSVAEELQPFLAQFQSEAPMLPFLGTALKKLLRSLMSKTVKRAVLMAVHSPLKLLKVNMDLPVNIFPAPKIDLGFAAKNALRKVPKLSDLTILQFRSDCGAFVKTCGKKIVERSPLKFKLTRGSSSLDPACVLISELGERRLTDAQVEALTERSTSG